jgi:hypothetical protein
MAVWSYAMAGVSIALWLLDLLPRGCPWQATTLKVDRSGDVFVSKLMV